MAHDYESMLALSKEGGHNCERVGILYFGSICRAYQTWAQAQLTKPADYIDEFKQCLTHYEDAQVWPSARAVSCHAGATSAGCGTA
jgi:hypothetical protein